MSEEEIKRMADLLRAGAIMLSEYCPKCSSPLFKIGDEIRCPRCDKPVVFVKGEEEVAKITTPALLGVVEETILTKLQEINQQIKAEKDPSHLQQLGGLLSTWLEALEKLKKLRKG